MTLLLSRATFARVIFKNVSYYCSIMWTVNSLGRSYINGKPLSKDLRSAIVDIIVNEGGDLSTGEVTALTPE